MRIALDAHGYKAGTFNLKIPESRSRQVPMESGAENKVFKIIDIKIINLPGGQYNYPWMDIYCILECNYLQSRHQDIPVLGKLKEIFHVSVE